MKRGGPLRRTTHLTSRTPIKRVSQKRALVNQRRSKILTRMRAEQDWCTRCGTPGVPLDGHEKLRRSQGGDSADATQIILLCRPCHDWIGQNPAQAVATGWAKWSWQK